MARTVRANLPLKLDGSKNTRELGGYPVVTGGNTANGQFLRSDKPSRFTEADCQRLYNYGVRLVLDLRSEGEIEQEPSALKGFKDIEYLNLNLLDNINSAGGDVEFIPKSLSDLYINLLEVQKTSFLSLFRAVLCHPDDCVFFNCTAGKDRTGITAVILLKLADRS